MSTETSITTTTHCVGNVSYSLDTSAVEVVVVLAGFNKQLVLYVSLHLFSRPHKVIFATINFSVVWRPRSIWKEHIPVSYTHLTLPTNREV